MFGFLNVNKPKGMTSHDVVAKIRRVTKIKQVGHTGTLDPFAEGVLPICIGKSTRLIEYLNDDKEYLATVRFGKNTDSYDLDGEITQTFEKRITREDLEKVLPCFRGEILQKPPIYSAIKVNGKATVILKNYAPYIDKQTVKKLFEKFVRLDDKTTRTTRGTGLGLFIVKGLLSAMGGTIFIKSTPNNEFFTYVTLPSEEE